MRKWIYCLALIIPLGCSTKKTDTYFTPEKAAGFFNIVKEICNRDSGRLWGKNLYGPLMFVDRPSRRIIANQPDEEGLLKGKDKVFTGFYPKELIISNTPVKFDTTSSRDVTK